MYNMSLAIFLIAFIIWVIISIHYGPRSLFQSERDVVNATNVTEGASLNGTGNATDYPDFNNNSLQDLY